MKNYRLTLAFVLLFVSACGSVQIDTPITSVTPAPTGGSLSIVDSEQRLGSGRSWDVSLGDLDGDGDLDAVVANSAEGVDSSEVWLNDGRGFFTLLAQNLGYGMGLALGDLDGDGDLDFFKVGWEQAGEVWMNNGAAIFTDTGQRLGIEGGFDAVLGDVDKDGDLDVLIAHEKEDTVWINDGNGSFADTGQRLGTTYTAAADFCDVDGDGDLDALTVGWSEPGRVWLNDGLGSFSDSGQILTPGHVHIHGMGVGDIDGDGAPDAFLAGSPNQIWLNDGTGIFHRSEQELDSFAGDSVAIDDLDSDGDLDVYLAVGDWSGSADKIWLNEGNGRLRDSGLTLSNVFSSGIGLGDLDGDGDMDAFVVHGELGQASNGGVANEVWFNMAK
jgi:hypothetical protein